MNNETAALPIGVFDSGLGGLTVLKTLIERFPHENFVYLGDTARIPYGIKSARTIQKYLEQAVNVLLRHQVKAVVVACNSASTQVHSIKATVPIYNVIEPGARAAAVTTENSRIGVIATKATVANRTYVTELLKLNPSLAIFQQPCPLLVPLVEEGWDEDPITNLIVYRYLNPLMAAGIDTLILGCTHYPILKNAILKVVTNHVQLIDSSMAICDVLQSDFASDRLKSNLSTNRGSTLFLATDVSESFQAMAQRVMSPLPVKQFELIDFVN